MKVLPPAPQSMPVVAAPGESSSSLAGVRRQAEQDRDDAVRLREQAASLREDAVRGREEAGRKREEAECAKSDVDAFVLTQLQEANENLVLASLRAQATAEASERSSRQKEEFLAMLAHELRNPLAPIVNALGVLRRVETPEPLVPWAHDIIRRQVDQLTRLLDDLLDVARVTSGKIELQKRSITVAEIMRQAVETSGSLIGDRNQRLIVDVPSQALTIDGDPARLTQILSNLLNNACKYTQENGTISFSARQSGDTVVLTVADNGCGIQPDALPGIFGLFIQERRSLDHSQGGLGIGLALVRAITELHGGTVEAASGGPDQGSEFSVTLPLARNLLPEVVFTADARPALPAGCCRIVLIEDNVDAGVSLKTLLHLMGCEVSIAFDGAAGVALVQAERPHVVLCDIGLPVMDGYAVVAELRAKMKPPLPLMIALTGYGQPEDCARALAAGYDLHLVKPVDADEIMNLISLHTDAIGGATAASR